MSKQVKQKQCRNKGCDNYFTPFKSTDKYCSIECFKANYKPNLQLSKMKPIKAVSDKRKELNKIYEKVRIEVLSEAKFKCFINGCTNVATSCEHLAGRIGFYDEWAKENNIPLLIDKRFLRACCVPCNGKLETDSELSKKYQYSKISGIKKSEL
jgi:hypothetical protein